MAQKLANGQILASDKSFKIEKILKKFSSQNCPQLEGKPKIFFFLTSPRLVDYKFSNYIALDGSMSVANLAMPTSSDQLLVYVSSDESKMQRSWFIQEMCKELDRKIEDLFTILTNVSRKLVTKAQETKSDVLWRFPIIISTLTKKLYLFHKHAAKNKTIKKRKADCEIADCKNESLINEK